MLDLSPRTLKALRNLTMVLVALLAPILIIATMEALEVASTTSSQFSSRLAIVMFADMILVMIIAVLILLQAIRKLTGSRNSDVQSPILLRLSRLLAVVAVVLATTLAAAAILTFSVGSNTILNVIASETLDDSQAAAETYLKEEADRLQQTVAQMSSRIGDAIKGAGGLGIANLRAVLQEVQGQATQQLTLAYIVDRSCKVEARGIRSYHYDYTRYIGPPKDMLAGLASTGEDATPSECENGSEPIQSGSGLYEIRLSAGDGPRVFRKIGSNVIFAVHGIDDKPELFLVAAVEATEPIVELHDTIRYNNPLATGLVARLTQSLVFNSIIYLGITLVVLIVIIRLGIGFAHRISRPIEEMAGVAKNVEGGNMDVRFKAEGNDEVAMLGQTFNDMVARLKSHTANLIELKESAVRREQTFSSVLSSVTAGVIGLDRDERIVFMNRSAADVLETDPDDYLAISERRISPSFEETVTEFSAMLNDLKRSRQNQIQGPVDLHRQSIHKSLHVRIAKRKDTAGEVEGFVVAFDDVTELVKARNRAAWSEVAQVIAHEIKNPVYPLQSCAQRLEAKEPTASHEELRRIVRDYVGIFQKNVRSLLSIAEEFSSFSKFKDPVLQLGDVREAVAAAVRTEEMRERGISISVEAGEPVMETWFDPELFHLALLNLLKNAGEAIDDLKDGRELPTDFCPEIRVSIADDGDMIEIRVMDNGIGFPDDKEKFLTMFRSTKQGDCRGLGLPNVDRVISGHGGTMVLEHAPVFEGCDHAGAMVTVRIPSRGGLTTQPEDIEDQSS